MKLLQALKEKQKVGQALLAVNFYNMETLLSICRAARRQSSPIILQTSPSTLKYTGLSVAVAMARAAASQEGVQAWLHLDHCHDSDLIQQCIDAGYDSVMIDASEQDIDNNIKLTRQAIEMARPAGVCVEAELGYIPKLEQSALTSDGMTTPEEAQRFVEATEVDMLAVSIGSAHGFYKEEPDLDFTRLKTIRNVVEIPLVLHGGSGLSAQQWKRAIELGIVKVNFATEVKDTFMQRLKQTLEESNNIDLRKVFPPAMKAVEELVSKKMLLCSNKPAPSSLKTSGL